MRRLSSRFLRTLDRFQIFPAKSFRSSVNHDVASSKRSSFASKIAKRSRLARLRYIFVNAFFTDRNEAIFSKNCSILCTECFMARRITFDDGETRWKTFESFILGKFPIRKRRKLSRKQRETGLRDFAFTDKVVPTRYTGTRIFTTSKRNSPKITYIALEWNISVGGTFARYREVRQILLTVRSIKRVNICRDIVIVAPRLAFCSISRYGKTCPEEVRKFVPHTGVTFAVVRERNWTKTSSRSPTIRD